jgi:hypothetical protein
MVSHCCYTVVTPVGIPKHNKGLMLGSIDGWCHMLGERPSNILCVASTDYGVASNGYSVTSNDMAPSMVGVTCLE